MSDFIYTNEQVEHEKLTSKIKKIYSGKKPKVKEFHGEWGSLAVSHNLYNGFQPYENKNHIVVVIGGPILYFKDNSFLNENNSNTGTKAIYDFWIKRKIKWDQDLSGPFAILIIDKKTSNIEFISDLMSFIPIYSYRDSTKFMLSTHVDVLANVARQNKMLDLISLSDFVLHGTVTFPYTVYQKIFQVKPASTYQYIYNSNKLTSQAYWVPKEEYKYNSIKEAADDLAKSLWKYVNRVTSEVSNIAQFISGGEDSRVLSAILKNNPRDAFIFLDQINREGKIAKNAAHAYGAKFNFATRSKTHYIEILPNCSKLVGSGSQYRHAHTFGFHRRCKLYKYSSVFGGLFSDALLKGARIKKIPISIRLPLLPDIIDRNYSAGKQINNNIFTKETLEELTQRRREHLNYVKQFRNESAEEWFELWPSSMNHNIPNIHANRRLFRSYEPFMANDVVKISASVPQKWKLNRRLFLKATKPLLKPTKWLFHGEGRLPYFPWYINSFIQFIYRVYRKIGIHIGFIKGNQGPWGEWNAVVNSYEWEESINKYYKEFSKIDSVFRTKDIKNLLKNDEIHHFQRVNLMQVLYQIHDNNN